MPVWAVIAWRSQQPAELLFTENDTNARELFNYDGPPYAKDAFHDYVIHGQSDAVNPARFGSKAAIHYALQIEAGQQVELQFRLFAEVGKRDGSFRRFLPSDLQSAHGRKPTLSMTP